MDITHALITLMFLDNTKLHIILNLAQRNIKAWLSVEQYVGGVLMLTMMKSGWRRDTWKPTDSGVGGCHGNTLPHAWRHEWCIVSEPNDLKSSLTGRTFIQMHHRNFKTHHSSYITSFKYQWSGCDRLLKRVSIFNARLGLCLSCVVTGLKTTATTKAAKH